MKEKGIIQLKPSARIPYMHVWCRKCGTCVKTCRKNGKELSQCEQIEYLYYRAAIYIPGTEQRIVRTLGKDFNKALQQLAILRQQVKDGEIEARSNQMPLLLNGAKQIRLKPLIQRTQTKPFLLIHIFGRYLAELNGEGVASHLRIIRSKPHVTDVKNCFKKFCLSLKNGGYDLTTFRLVDISDDIVGKFHDQILSEGYSSNSYNRFFSHLTSFALWAEREEYGSAKRFFERVPRRTITPHPEIITADEFKKVLSVISHENGFQYNIGERKHTRNHYREYLVSAFRFALFTGRRREEIVTVKFTDILTDEKGKALIITFTDHKVSRILHITPGEERKLYTPVTKELASFLDEIDFQEKKHKDDFILESQILHNRVANMCQALSRGFSHYWKIAFPDSKREVSFKSLRKTYLTNFAIHMGKDVRSVSGHSSEQVLKHYIDEKQVAIAESFRGFSVFGEEANI